MTQPTVPTLDISSFAKDQDAFVAQLGAAYQEWGFAGIQNHGISTDLIRRAMAVMEAVFSLPEDTKKQYFKDNGGTRGYTPFGTEIAKNADHVDLKEFWHVGREISGTPPYPQLTPNVWPEEVPEFKPVMLELFTELDKLANTMLRAFALFIGEKADFFEDKANWGNSILRPLHYPPITDPSLPNVRAGAHEDINLITLLVGSEQEGLEVLSKKGEWVGISMIEGTIICNVGDMLQRLTNKVLPSTTHRVVNPKGEAGKTSRYSIPFFMHANPDMSLDCLPQCVTEENPKQFEPTTAHDYLMERLREIGLVK
ncbi:2-oxoglutarate and iron-dependent oxygenase domain-containing protein [Reinekea marina]|uniref:Isopenicillin N synthase family dioxygenase n=1 Tax=Reinekea marina TaxID=1310421 RepID=A0ABV7WUM6_9GAMM|nr:2-oxoglutarate and iron-dependent oxygenase domain-containing protein [Reinekea marina]MDN3647549.1 2-oxoglutarate and iron-dependent oxygenase domain-containing protein [Reinekea marina]MDN3651118.1 2-oxoglutarate and iron-dependent oxygenase domain-containing protein [Reinekea marina]